MRIVDLYKYQGENGIIISVCKLPMEYTSMIRLIADNNKLLFNGNDYFSVIDIEVIDIDLWSEIDTPADNII